MLILLGAANILLGLFLALYTLGALLYILPEYVTKAGKIFTGIAGFGLGVGMLFSGINVISGAISTVEVGSFTVFLGIAVALKTVPLIAIAVLLYLIMTRKYHKRKEK